ncbi:hypothetical protein KOR42_34390 [Thalassoglobus neptunius]|uniref:Uncharacterized protein n=1 Tax=Thalassoglobus neptunius TaxID=1938619 RepID=A0A5C5WPH6_9PLAN|nr:hypothetical protein [Thalassoglobus neptunius]TWT51752.1 hypothetical protein KOR42_34390 [Thalassoglobus neptunius]
MSRRVTKKFQITTGRTGHRKIQTGARGKEVPTGRVPRVARMLALAIRLESLLKNGFVGDQAEIARLGHVSRARVTQIMNLLSLAPDIQEEILFLPRIHRGRDTLLERDLRQIAAEPNWIEQRKRWAAYRTQQND